MGCLKMNLSFCAGQHTLKLVVLCCPVCVKMNLSISVDQHVLKYVIIYWPACVKKEFVTHMFARVQNLSRMVRSVKRNLPAWCIR